MSYSHVRGLCNLPISNNCTEMDAIKHQVEKPDSEGKYTSLGFQEIVQKPRYKASNLIRRVVAQQAHY